DENWLEVQARAQRANAWFTKEHIEIAVKNIATEFLEPKKLETWVKKYLLPTHIKTVGIVMAGNIPLVGFHDLLCGFVSGHNIHIKVSSKDEVLIKHVISKLIEWEPSVAEQVNIFDMIKGCNAYIATGSNNTARYFEQYFGKYPHIIRSNRTSVALLDGTETDEQLHALAGDIFLYFGLGCRNVTQINVPNGYDFKRLLDIFSSHDDIILHHKYKHNYDYYLAIYLLNKVPYLTNDSILLVENLVPFSAVSVLHYSYYNDKNKLIGSLQNNNDIQCIVGNGFVPFGMAQVPSLSDYADGVDTMVFFCSL
ncbi:MAG: acyl-CoA reductase, partial [Bacteroidota bacterium]